MRKIVMGVVGPSVAKKRELEQAFNLGKLIAKKKYVLLTGGFALGVMDAVNRGAKAGRGMTVGVLSSKDTTGVSKFVDIAIVTQMGSARNNINVLSSDIVVACGNISLGTLSEIALALKANKKVILMTDDKDATKYLKKTGGKNIFTAKTPMNVMALIKRNLNN